MAITRAQQYRQMLEDGGMLVQPGFGGIRQGYRGDAAGHGTGDPGESDGPGGGSTGGNGGREDRIGGQYSSPEGRAVDRGLDRDRANEAFRQGLTKSLTQQSRRAALDRALSFLPGGKRSITGLAVRGFKSLFGGPKTGFSTQGAPYGNVPGSLRGRDITSTDDDDDDRGGGDGMPLYAQLGYPSQQAYMAAMQRATQAPAGLPAAVQPMQTMDLNRIAYRLMADGGFLGEEDEPRQAYGLGSIVRKITRPIKKVVKKATKAVKKVTKSPIGRLAIAVAAPYALGPAMANAQFLAGLSAAQKAAVISGATTGITQLASGEDLDLKDIALSAALSGGISKLTTPAAAGVDPSSAAGRARVASDAASRPSIIPDRGMGQITSRSSIIPDRGMGQITSRPNLFDADDVVLASQRATSSSIVPPPKPSVIPDRGMGQIFERAAPKDTGILQTLKNFGTKVKDSKLTDVLLRNKEGKISPMKSILLASALSGLAAKKDQEPDEFSEMDRGEGIDIPAIRRRPFDFMAPRFAGSQFDFYAADGGRIGYSDGTKTNETQEAGAVLSEKEIKKIAKSALYKGFKKMYSVDPQMAKDNPAYEGKFDTFKKIYDQKFQKGGRAEPVAKKTMPLLDMGGKEMDLRDNGGFVPIGRMEKADDVPARLSKNEFVFTADAVRNAGDGNVDKGAEVMYNMMKNLEAGGDVSKESQGLKGARRMFQTSQRLEEVL